MFKSHPGGTGFEGMKASWRAAEARHCERPWKAIGKSAQLQLIAQDWRGHAKELRLGTMKRAYERLLVKPNYSRSQQCFGDASAMRWSPRTAAAAEYRQLESRRQAVCYKGQSWRSDPSPWRGPKDCELYPRHWTIIVWVLLLIVTMPWYFSLLKEESILMEPTS